MDELLETFTIDCLAGIELPDNPNSRLDAWFEQLDEIESSKDAT